MKFFVKGRFLLALGVFAALLLGVIWPMVLLRELVFAISGTPLVVRRHANGRWIGRWVQRIRHGVLPIIRHRIRIVPPVLPEGVTGPFILIGNHVSALDTVYCTVMADELGVPDARWIVKDEFRRYPAFGAVASALGYQFISRSRADLDPITAFALQAAQDRCSVGILPEGTRWQAGQSDPDFTHVRRPKVAGFRALVQQLPHYPVLSFTIRGNGKAGRNLIELDAYFDQEVVVEAVYKGCIFPEDAETFLLDDFRRKDRLLSFVSP